ncbi:hypothetical protein HBB16_12555 [Pseudonocardia sp. MCCB 268]|nr:hypothetical protein [Pseudonocardia cytotoxica]
MSTLCRMVVQTGYDDSPDAEVLPARPAHSARRHGRDDRGLRDGRYSADRAGADKGRQAGDGVAVLRRLSRPPRRPWRSARPSDGGDLHEEAGHISERLSWRACCATGLRPAVTGRIHGAGGRPGDPGPRRLGLHKVISRAVKDNDRGATTSSERSPAVGKLLGFTQEQLENAQGIARR